MLGKELARQFDGTQIRGAKRSPGPHELTPQETVIEARVMGDEEASLQALEDILRDVGKGRCVSHHRVVDPGELSDERRDFPFGVDQRAPFADATFIDCHDADLNDPIVGEIGTGRFEVYKDHREKTVMGGRRRRFAHAVISGEKDKSDKVGRSNVRIICIM